MAPGTFANFSNLNSVDLTYNDLKQIDNSVFAGSVNLRQVYLTGNPIISRASLQSICPTSGCIVYF